MSLINVNANFSGADVKGFFKEIINQPKWLITGVVISLIAGLVYFGYNKFSYRSSILELEKEVKEIKVKANEGLNIDEYKEDLVYVITEIKLLQQEANQSFEDELLEIDLLIAFINQYHPNDPIINDLKAMKSRLEVNHDTYKLHYDYVMKELNNVITDSIQ